jgi:hypothetical protein
MAICSSRGCFNPAFTSFQEQTDSHESSCPFAIIVVDGILLAGTGKNKKLVRDIQVSGIPVTQVIRIQDDTLSSVTVDYVKCGYEAVTYLYGRGSLHPGLITGSFKIISL